MALSRIEKVARPVKSLGLPKLRQSHGVKVTLLMEKVEVLVQWYWLQQAWYGSFMSPVPSVTKLQHRLARSMWTLC